MKALKRILLTAIIAVPLYIAIADPFFGMFQPVNKVAQEDDYDDEDYDDTIEDQEVHIDGFPVIYIEGNNEIEKESWEGFLTELQNECNIPWLTKNVSSIHFCSDDNFIESDQQVVGYTKHSDNSIYIREDGDEGYDETIIHEFGHAYDHAYGITTGNYDISVLISSQDKICKNNAIDFGGNHCLSNYKETFADSIMLYVLYSEAGYLPEEVSNWIDTLPR